jgi:hypothetical protein
MHYNSTSPLSLSGTGCERQVSRKLPRASSKQIFVTGKFLFLLVLYFAPLKEEREVKRINYLLQVLVNCLRYFLRRPETDIDSY